MKSDQICMGRFLGRIDGWNTAIYLKFSVPKPNQTATNSSNIIMLLCVNCFSEVYMDVAYVLLLHDMPVDPNTDVTGSGGTS